MPDLTQSLSGNDLGFLKIIASFWGIDLTPPELPSLVAGMLDKALLWEIIEALPTESRTAFDYVAENQGKMPWQFFIRRFGDVRMMGAGRRDRERPDLHPISPAEVLWYRGLIRKAFFKITGEPQEYAYIPDDLFHLIQPENQPTQIVIGRPASPVETTITISVSDHILDDCCSLLASIRSGIPLPIEETDTWLVQPGLLKEILINAGLVEKKNKPQTDKVREFLESPRNIAYNILVKTWLNSKSFNELHHLEGLKFEGNWSNDPFQARHFVLDLISSLPESTWWSITAFLSGMRERFPDFQRPAGDYDSWFIFKESQQNYLRGISSWDEVDGALLKFLINGPFYWFGLLDLAIPNPGAAPTAFRRSYWFEDLAAGNPPANKQSEKLNYHITIDGQFQIQHNSPRSFRYQVARFCRFEKHIKGQYFYRLSPESLSSAAQQGLNARHLLTLIKKYPPANAIPPGLLHALERWEKLGLQVRMEQVITLQVASRELIEILKNNPRARRYLGDELNPTTIIIKPAGKEIIRSILMEAGYLMGTFSDQ